MKKKQHALLHSFIALLLCVSMLVGSTFAWFTDSVSSVNNIITAGNLDVELEYLDSKGNWKAVDSTTEIFDDNSRWEPGHTEVAYLRVSNLGTLALKYQLGVNIVSETGSTNVNGKEFKLSDYIYFGAVDNVTTKFAGREEARDALTKSELISKGYTKADKIEAGAPAQYVALVVYMPEEVGNEANHAKNYAAPKIELGINVIATQVISENDSFGNDYDDGASFPETDLTTGITVTVTPDANNKVSTELTISSSSAPVYATVPAGVQLEAGTTSMTLSVSEMANSKVEIPLGVNEIKRSLDVHISGVAASNTVPMLITVPKAMMTGLNMGNYKLYHVENGTPVQMTYVADAAELDAHNEFTYDPVTGDVTMALASFSEVALVAEPPKWEGNFDYSWYDADATEYIIANADELAGFSAIVGGMNGQTQNSFSGKTIKLVSDINLGDEESENKTNIIFYPIGYYNSDGTYERTNTAITSGLRNFEGTFDGNGHTIANFYQNTWEMKGDHDWYDATLQYYRDGMGLFGKVYGGTVKNLTVDNFSSDGEIATTGVIAAYAEGATFENIAITNCNPRVYNIGNGGIVGCVGWYAKEAGLKTTFTNITVDNTNKISALWGSYDVACGGIVGQYYPTSGQSSANYPVNAGIHFENCHVSAVMDVYNDVCANYQYYAYRYTGMLIGSVRENETIDGHVYPKMDGITASGCTVHFGTWNDYYYCEIIDNTTASYTHDYQMSRLEQVTSVDVAKKTVTNLKGETTAIPTTGRANYVVVSGDHATENATCYHFKDGAVWTHDMGGIQTGIDEDGDGQDDLKEDKQHIYLEFNNLVTGYGWGVTTKGVGDLDGVTILDREVADSKVKFEKADNAQDIYMNGKPISISDLFKAAQIDDDKLSILNPSVSVTVSPVGDDSTAGGTYTANTTDWTQGILTFTGTGTATITITDYYFCTPTTITVTITEREAEEKFETKFTGDFLYRVGNQNAVKLDSLFKAKDGANIGTVSVTIEALNSTAASGTYTSNATWTNGTIQFSGTGVVKVTITDNDYCTPTELYLEVVDAVNATTATSAKNNNVVLLNDVNFSTIEVSNGYTLYGNGFKMTAKNDVMYDALGVGFVTLKNGTLDNVQIICPDFSYAIIYTKNITEAGNQHAKSSDSSSDAYGNVRSAVMADGNSNIINSYIHGGRAAVFLRSGNLLIDGSTISGGAAANIHAVSAQSLTLRDATLIQKPFQATVHDTSKTVMGFSGLFECDENGNSTPLILEGTLIQYAWVNEGYKQYTPSDASSIIDTALDKEEYLHDLNNDGTKESLNLGFTFIPQNLGGSTKADVTDNRTNINTVPYATVDVGNAFASAKVYSYKNTNSTSIDFVQYKDYVPTAQGVTAPTVSFTDTNADRVFETKFDTSDNRWESTLTVNLDNGNYTFDFNKLLVQKHGNALSYTVKTADGTAIDTSKTIALTASGVTEYVLTVTDGGVDHTVYFILTATKTSIPEPEVVDTTGGTPLLVVKSKNSDWSCAIPALEGIKVKYYTSANNSVTLDLATLTPTSTGKQNGTNNYWETTMDGYKLKVTCGYIHDTKQIYGMPVVVNNGGNKMYFTISSTNGYVSTSTSGRTVTITYEFTDPNGKTLTFSKTWQFNYADYKNGTQYSYSDFVNGTLKEASGGVCVTGDTLVTLADGTLKEIQYVTYEDMLLGWNLYEGEYQASPAAYIIYHGDAIYRVIHLNFDDGSTIKIIGEHGFLDVTTGQYEFLDEENVTSYIGHQFVKQEADGHKYVTLENFEVREEYTGAYSIASLTCNNAITNSMITLTPVNGFEDSERFFNFLEMGEGMYYDQESLQKDIETYGLFEYEDLAEYLTEEEFAFVEMMYGHYCKIAIGKGYYTLEEFLGTLSHEDVVNN